MIQVLKADMLGFVVTQVTYGVEDAGDLELADDEIAIIEEALEAAEALDAVPTELAAAVAVSLGRFVLVSGAGYRTFTCLLDGHTCCGRLLLVHSDAGVSC